MVLVVVNTRCFHDGRLYEPGQTFDFQGTIQPGSPYEVVQHRSTPGRPTAPLAGRWPVQPSAAAHGQPTPPRVHVKNDMLPPVLPVIPDAPSAIDNDQS